MSSAISSFQTTVFDYLRIVFHRLHIIVGVMVVTVGAAWVWTEMLVPRDYRSNMTVMVWSRDMDNPLVKRMVQQAPLERVIATIRTKLQVDRRLQVLACNLRFALKNETYLSYLKQHWKKDGLVFKDALSNEVLKLEQGVAVNIRSGGLLGRIPKVGDRLVGTYRTEIRLSDVPGLLDLQSLVAIVTEDAYLEVPLRDDHIERFDANPQQVSFYLSALRKRYGSQGTNEDYQALRNRAVEELGKRLRAEASLKGAGGFSDRQARELLKEFYCYERLAETKLLHVCQSYFAGDVMHYWVQRLKDGLSVGGFRANMINIECVESLYPDRRPYYRKGRLTNLLSHIILNVAYAMIEAEFRSTEATLWNDALSLIKERKDELAANLDRLNKEMYNFRELRDLQLSFLQKPKQPDALTPENVRDPHWAEDFVGVPETSRHIARISELTDEILQIDRNIAKLEAQAKVLQNQIDNPQQQYIEIRTTVRKEDPPEMQALRGELVLKQLELKKWLEKSTLKHPIVRRLEKEIQEINNALRQVKPGATMEEVEKAENPKIREWKDSLQQTEKELEGFRAERKRIQAQIEKENQKAESAMVNQRIYMDRVERQKDLRRQLTTVQRQEEELLAKYKVSMKDHFDVNFEVHTASRRPGAHYAPKEGLVLLMAFMIGCAASGGFVFLLEYTDHSVKTIDDVRRHIGLPVLGTIPEYDFAAIEAVERHSRGGWFGGGRGRVYPASIQESEPESVHDRAKVRSSGPLLIRYLIVAAVILSLVAAGLGVYKLAGLGGQAAKDSGAVPAKEGDSEKPAEDAAEAEVEEPKEDAE